MSVNKSQRENTGKKRQDVLFSENRFWSPSVWDLLRLTPWVFWSEIFTRHSSLCLLSFGWNLSPRLVPGEFFRNFVQTKAILLQNLWNFALLSAIFIRVRIALKNFTQVLSYVVCTQVRRHVRKQITERRYGEEKPGRFVFGKPVLFTLGLGLTAPYSLGIFVWNFY